ncbi:MAG: CBS domain-containing protein, partial [Solirubrobacterales bacterium]
MSKKAREVMTEGCECVGEKESIRAAAEKLASLNVGSMPICGEDDRLKGMLTDRDIAVKVVAEGRDPESTTAGDLAQGKPVTIGADDSVEEALSVMSEHQIRRLPVIDGHDLVGIVSQADVARNLPDDKVGDLVQAI